MKKEEEYREDDRQTQNCTEQMRNFETELGMYNDQ